MWPHYSLFSSVNYTCYIPSSVLLPQAEAVNESRYPHVLTISGYVRIENILFCCCFKDCLCSNNIVVHVLTISGYARIENILFCWCFKDFLCSNNIVVCKMLISGLIFNILSYIESVHSTLHEYWYIANDVSTIVYRVHEIKWIVIGSPLNLLINFIDILCGFILN